MRYQKIVRGIFLNRPNRFIAQVEIDGEIETVHVKNTGRCKEILVPGQVVLLEESNQIHRKTKYDLVAAYKNGFGLINIDSQAPNRVMMEWLIKQEYDYVKPEYRYGDSRIDFYMEKNGERYLMEVKGCTLEVDGVGYFPDAPTERGVKHLKELMRAREEGYHSILAFVIQMDGIQMVYPNGDTHPEFKETLLEAQEKGVEVQYFCCHVEETGLEIKTCF